MRKTWKISEPDVELNKVLVEDLNISALMAQILINRGIKDKASAHLFLDSRLDDLLDPFLMEGMQEAVARIEGAVTGKEKVFIATDFDVDGLTSCAVLEMELKKRGLDVTHYLPHRQRDGYGLNEEAVRKARACGAKLFISLDCGITALNEVRQLMEVGIDVIIVDHHQPPQQLPEALAILDPKKRSCPYPFKELASVGLVFKLIQGLRTVDARAYLDLVALGTVADVVDLKGENRIFVRHGLDLLNTKRRQGLHSLIEAAGIKGKKLSTHSISFILAPRLNASGRMDSADASLDLLLSEDAEEANRLASDLNDHNRRRQRIEGKCLGEAMDLIEREVNFKDDFIIVLSKEDWHPGVLGIVASKIVDRFYRPAVIISLAEDVGKGSARSVHNFHIYEAFTKCEKFLKEYGGHRYAAGLCIERKHIEAFKKLLNTIAKESFEADQLSPVLKIDASIPFACIDANLLRFIDTLTPFGAGNRKPLFVSRGLTVKSNPVLVGRNTLKFWVSDGSSTFEAIGFGMGDFFNVVCASEKLDLAYSLTRDEWTQEHPIKLELKDIRVSS